MPELQWYCAGSPVAVPDNHRAAQFGDGVFETMRRADNGSLPLWPLHRQRLQRGLVALDFPIDTLAQIEQALAHFEGQGRHNSGLKLLVSRGDGGRGYGYHAEMQPLVMLQSFEVPDWPSAPQVMTVSDVRLSHQPLLAGIKHLNRLEQVLARGRLARCWDDCLMLDGDEQLIESSCGNVFAYVDGRWQTPDLTSCGVNGVVRQWLLQQAPIEVTKIHRSQLAALDTLFVSNAVRGLVPVSRIDDINLPMSQLTQITDWQSQLQQLFSGRLNPVS